MQSLNVSSIGVGRLRGLVLRPGQAGTDRVREARQVWQVGQGVGHRVQIRLDHLRSKNRKRNRVCIVQTDAAPDRLSGQAGLTAIPDACPESPISAADF